MREFIKEIKVTEEFIDEQNHVNNLVYIRWMIDIATEHSRACGCTDLIETQGKTWVIREHNIRYLASAILDDVIIIRTFPESFGKFKSRRCYEMIRKSDSKKLVSAWTDWVLVDVHKHRPCLITEDIIKTFA